MSLFFGGEKVEAVLFSPLEGQLTFEGKPAAGAKIKLRLAWKDKEGETYYYTADDQGFFKIPKHMASYKQNPLAQLVIRQELTVEYKGEIHEVWTRSKKEPAEFTELGGEPVDLICELTNELDAVRGERSLGRTVCTWKSLKNN